MAAVIYLDNAASAPPHPRLAEWMAELLPKYPWNPHGTTCFSEQSRRLILKAEERLLSLAGTTPAQCIVLWTSGITEALNLAANADYPPRGAELQGKAPPRFLGIPHPAMEESFRLHTYSAPVLAINHVNSETGETTDVRKAAAENPQASIVLDAAQSFGKIPLDWEAMRLDAAALSSRKIGGPASVGALLVRKGIPLHPLMRGGGQQKGIRPGTVDAVGIELFVRVAEECCREMQGNHEKVLRLNRLFWSALPEELPQAVRISPEDASPWIAMCAFPGYEGAVLARILAQNHNIIVAPSSACTAERGLRPRSLAHLDERTAKGALRVSFAPDNTESDVRNLLAALAATIKNY